ncbi:MAG: prepilin-type N-terminal cleavage/methylation domain-containing protein [Gemmatimonadota bacterium]|nr:MAG: prepilin-type N-terminal cleavage/methylation domain-containing protein [Gemmatimonadota bacterium]
MKRRRPGRAGYSLVEMMIALLVSMVVMAAIMGMVIHQQRFYLVANDISETLSDLQRVETVVIPELLPLSPGAGDIVFAGDDSIKMRVFRGVYSVCDKLIAPEFAIVVRNLTGNSVPLTTDSVFVYARGIRTGLSDDWWRPVKMSSVNETTCPDGAPGWRAVIPELNGMSFEIPVGSPVRAFRHGSYWLELLSDGWYLKTDATSGTAVAVAGPLVPPDSAASAALQFRYLNVEGGVATTNGEIARIDLDVSSLGTVPGMRDGLPHRAQHRLSFDIRNN